MAQVSAQRTFGFASAIALLLMAIFGTLLWQSRKELREEIRLKLIERDAAVLYPVALHQVESEAETRSGSPTEITLTGLLRQARQQGMLAMAIFDPEGRVLDAVPASQAFVELPTEDYLTLVEGETISRYYPALALDQLLTGVPAPATPVPVLEIILPLRRQGNGTLLGFVRYHLDGRSLAEELTVIEARLNRHLAIMMGIGFLLIAVVVAAAAFGITRSQRILAERNERLARANFELSLSAKASAIGQITSHLIHGLQGPVAGLRAAMMDKNDPRWDEAAAYTERLAGLIHETIELLGDTRTQTHFEISGAELVDTILRRGQTHAKERQVNLSVVTDLAHTLDSHRGGLLCLIAANLVHNAIDATDAGRAVVVSLCERGDTLHLVVTDQGSGIPPEIQARLFEPGQTSKPSGTGLGLAISHLLARQIGGDLELAKTGSQGTTFTVSLPHFRL